MIDDVFSFIQNCIFHPHIPHTSPGLGLLQEATRTPHQRYFPIYLHINHIQSTFILWFWCTRNTVTMIKDYIKIFHLDILHTVDISFLGCWKMQKSNVSVFFKIILNIFTLLRCSGFKNRVKSIYIFFENVLKLSHFI